MIAPPLDMKPLGLTEKLDIQLMNVPPIHCITPVWGETFSRCFVEVALPSWLADGNLPVLREVPGSLCHIFTRPIDQAMIESTPAFARLRQTIPVKFSHIPPD